MSPIRCLRLVLCVTSTFAAFSSWAQPAPDRATLARQTARRFPQPVRVGDLIGRKVLEPKESQPVLGRVADLVRRPDGEVDMVMNYGGVLGFGARPIAVPIEAVALLGEFVAVVGLTTAQLDALPSVEGPKARIAPGETIKVGLVRPFH